MAYSINSLLLIVGYLINGYSKRKFLSRTRCRTFTAIDTILRINDHYSIKARGKETNCVDRTRFNAGFTSYAVICIDSIDDVGRFLYYCVQRATSIKKRDGTQKQKCKQGISLTTCKFREKHKCVVPPIYLLTPTYYPQYTTLYHYLSTVIRSLTQFFTFVHASINSM